MNVFRLDLAFRRRLLAGFMGGLAGYAILIVALYPEFRHFTGLNSLKQHSPAFMALLGVAGPLTSPAGWLNVNIYANFLPLIVLLATVSYGASCLAGQDHDGILGLVASLPIPRPRIVSEKVFAMAAQSALLVGVVVVAILVGRLFDVSVQVSYLLEMSVAVALLAVDFGLVAMAASAFTGNRGTGIGIATALAAASYVVGSLAPVIGWLHPARFVSLFYWSVANGQLTSGVNAWSFLILLATGCVLAVLSVAGFRRLDLH